MSVTDFPTDVRLLLKGDTDAAQGLVSKGRSVLARAMELAERSGGSAKVTMALAGGVTVQALIIGAQKVVTITVPPPEAEVPPEQPPPITEVAPVPGGQPGLLSGWIRGPTFTDTTIGSPPSPRKILHDYRPIPETAKAYKLPDAFQAMRRLGYSQTNKIRPGLFSGAMKRVVQAIFGIGHVGDPNEMKDQSPRYIDLSVPAATRNVSVNYNWVWNKTHGIFKADDKNHWLIEVSEINGVLAMPLILMPDTMTVSYYQSKAKLNDIGTLRVLDEFGGIPTGESFPATGPALEAAITAGKVLRLLGASDLDAFYGNQFALAFSLGWAFADSGYEAHNTCMSERDEAFEFTSINPGLPAPYLCTEHWKIKLELTRHDRKKLTLDPPQPVGSGSATLQQLHIGRIDYDLTLGQMWTPMSDGTGMGLRRPSIWNTGRTPYQIVPPDRDENFKPADLSDWGGIMHVFFNGDRLERLKWIPRQLIRGGIRFEAVPGKFPILNFDMDYQTNCLWQSGFITETFYAQGPFVNITEFYGEYWSPPGFVGDSVDVRSENSDNLKDPTGDPGGIPTNWVIEDAHTETLYTDPLCHISLDPVCTGYWAPPPGWCRQDVPKYTYTTEPNPYVQLSDDLGDNQAYDDALNGHFRFSNVYCVIPAFCREGYVCAELMVDTFLLTTWTNPSPEDIASIDHPDYRASAALDRCCGVYADIYYPTGDITGAEAVARSQAAAPYYTSESSRTTEVTVTGFFGGIGVIDFDVADDRSIGEMKWGFNADAGPSEQFITQNGWQLLSDTAVEYIRMDLPLGMEASVPDKTNWIGTV